MVQNELRTVRSMGADSPPLKAETSAEIGSSVLGVQIVLRTVRPFGADSPPPTEISGIETL